ncbi:hypothetical protein GCM10008915_63870 [Bifidobacterium pullorum subsp. gallinarum]|jgi:hypothetical protein
MPRMTTQDEIRKSIIELRKIYNNLSDLQFSVWYSKKYKVKANEVYDIIQQEGKANA